MRQDVARWKRDPVAFITEVLVNPETGKPFELYPAQIAFLRRAFTALSDGSLPCPEVLFSTPKKSGKTTLASLILLYVIVVLGGPFAEGYCIANDFDQAVSRVFASVVRIIFASPKRRHIAKVKANRVTFRSTGLTNVGPLGRLMLARADGPPAPAQRLPPMIENRWVSSESSFLKPKNGIVASTRTSPRCCLIASSMRGLASMLR